jgi:hypothetical protein
VDYVEPQYHRILFQLADEGVEFIGVGMVAAILQGVPLTTMDLDIVHRRTPQNVARLIRVLADLDAVARNDPRRLRPNETHLLGPGHILLRTRFGDFDCLGTIDAGRGYEDLLPASIPLQFEGRTFQFLHLREILAIKKRAGRAKDLAAIPYIESTIDEVERNTGPQGYQT